MMRASGLRARQRGFFDFSMPELGIIFVVALVVLGPKKLPPLVQQIGRWVGRARQMARQFREQLEQEVNSINAVKPVPMPAPPEVGPTQPDVAAANNSGHGDIGSSAAGVTENVTPQPGPATAAPAPIEPAGNDIHPEGQMYFALNGTQPEVVAQDPYALQPAADDPQAVAETPAAMATEHPPAAPPPAVKAADPSQPATVEVIFPHDHV
jgi:sec-independent protein translocase protein TatB